MNICKYPLEFIETQKIYGRIQKPLTVQLQEGIPMLWAISSDGGTEAIVAIEMFRSGDWIGSRTDTYLSTIQLNGIEYHFFSIRLVPTEGYCQTISERCYYYDENVSNPCTLYESKISKSGLMNVKCLKCLEMTYDVKGIPFW